MKSCILEKPGLIRVADVPDPEPGPGDIVIRVGAALTCGTDLKAYRRGHPKMPCPTPFGHEFSGEIVAAGADVHGFKVGDAVMSANTGPCGTCFYCERRQENLCETLMDEMILGAYAEYLRIPARVLRSNVYVKPEGLPFEQAALLEPLSSVCFGMAQVGDSLLRPDATVLVLGAGPIALLWLLALRTRGVSDVIVGGRRPARLAVARKLGAAHTFGENDDLGAQVRELTAGRGADLVVECTGQPEVWQAAPGYARRGGGVILFGGCKPDTMISLDAYRIHYDGVAVTSPFHFRPRDVEQAYALLSQAKVDWAPLVTSYASIEQVPEVFERLDDGLEIKCAIVPEPERRARQAE